MEKENIDENSLFTIGSVEKLLDDEIGFIDVNLGFNDRARLEDAHGELPLHFVQRPSEKKKLRKFVELSDEEFRDVRAGLLDIDLKLDSETESNRREVYHRFDKMVDAKSFLQSDYIEGKRDKELIAIASGIAALSAAGVILILRKRSQDN